MENLKKVGNALATNIYNQFKNHYKVYTSWDPSGNGKEQVRWLKIVTALILEWHQLSQ